MPGTNWRSIALFVLTVPLIVLCSYGEIVEEFIHPFTLWTAEIVMQGIRLLGIEAMQDGTIIRHGAGFAYEITGRCAGLVPLSLLAMAIIVARVSPGRKLAGAAIGLPVLLLVNWARLVSLFWLGVHEPQWFGVAHDIVWQIVMVIATMVTWLVWRSYVGNPVKQVFRTSYITNHTEV